MKRTLTPKESKVAALTLLAVVLLLMLSILAVPFVVLHRHYDATIEDLTARLGRYYAIAGMRTELHKQIEALKAKGSVGFYLKNTSPSLAAAEVQELAKNGVEANGGKLTSIQILQHKGDEPFRHVSVTVQLTGTVGVIKNILHQAESSKPYLFIDNLSMRSPMANAVRGNPNLDPELMMQFDLTGYARPKEGQ